MAKLSPHEAAILFHDEFERSADTPEMKARRGEYASNIFNGRRQNSKYVRDPNYVSPREKFNAEQSYKDRIARAREYKAYGTNPNGLNPSSKKEVGLRQSAMNVSKLQNISPDDAEG